MLASTEVATGVTAVGNLNGASKLISTPSTPGLKGELRVGGPVDAIQPATSANSIGTGGGGVLGAGESTGIGAMGAGEGASGMLALVLV